MRRPRRHQVQPADDRACQEAGDGRPQRGVEERPCRRRLCLVGVGEPAGNQYISAAIKPNTVPSTGFSPNESERPSPDTSATPANSTGIAAATTRDGFSPKIIQARSGTSTTWLLARRVPRPAPMWSMERCHVMKSRPSITPAARASQRARGLRVSWLRVRHQIAPRTGTA